jgi:hypothetical protein
MEIGDIVTVVTVSGEYVGELVDRSNGQVEIKNPRMILSDGKGNMGFAKGICVSGVENPDVQIFNQFVFLAETNKQVSEGHRQAVSAIEIASPEILAK